MGTLVSLIGIYSSYKLDTPTGATVVCTFGLALIGMAIAQFLLKKSNLIVATHARTPHTSDRTPHT